MTLHSNAMVVVEAADEVFLVGGEPLEVLLELGRAVLEAADERGIPRRERLLVGVPDFHPLGTVVCVGDGVAKA